jgi:hypothetical protein
MKRMLEYIASFTVTLSEAKSPVFSALSGFKVHLRPFGTPPPAEDNSSRHFSSSTRSVFCDGWGSSGEICEGINLLSCEMFLFLNAIFYENKSSRFLEEIGMNVAIISVISLMLLIYFLAHLFLYFVLQVL